jgi:outer membrane protein TolC
MNNKLSSLLMFFSFSVAVYASPFYLSDAYELALQNNHGYKSKQNESDSFNFAQDQRVSKLYPQVQLALNGGLHDYIQNYSNETEITEFYKGYTLSLTQPLYHPELTRSVKQGDLRTEGAKTDTYKSSQSLGIDVSKAYFDLLVAHKSLELAEANHRFYILKYTRINEMLSEGLSNKMDLLETGIYRDQAMMEINTAIKKEHLSRRKLEDLTLTTFSELPSFVPNFVDNLKSLNVNITDNLDSNPDLRLAALSRRIANDEISVRYTEYYPKADLSLSRSENQTNDRTLYKTDNRAYIQISIPLYQGGQTSARIEEAKVLHTSAIEKESQTRQDLLYHFDELNEQFDLSLQNIQILESSRTSAQLNLSAIEIAQKAGLKSQVDILEAQAKLYQIEQDRLKQLSDIAITHISLLEMNGNLNFETLHTFEKQIFQTITK